MYSILRAVNTARHLVYVAKVAPREVKKQAKQTQKKFKAADNKKRLWMIVKVAGFITLIVSVLFLQSLRRRR